MQFIRGVCVITLVFIAFSCSMSNRSFEKKRDNMYIYLGSGFDHETVEIQFNDFIFKINASTDFSSGIVLSSYFKCSGNTIELIRNDSVVDSVVINPFKYMNLKVKTKESTLEADIYPSKGKYVIIDKDLVSKEMKVIQTKKPISVE